MLSPAEVVTAPAKFFVVAMVAVPSASKSRMAVKLASRSTVPVTFKVWVKTSAEKVAVVPKESH